MVVTLDLQSSGGRHAESRLEQDTIAWLTTVQPTGQPDTVPVWFLWRDNVILIYSQPHTRKLKNLAQNANVSVVLDDTDGGGDVVRIEGIAKVASDQPAANDVPAYAEKYSRQIRRSFGTAEAFARDYAVPLIVTPTKIHA
jgi:PPOX class probable F420-dependent enzyme